MSSEGQPWHGIANEAEVASPALLIYPDRIEGNLRQMIAIAGGVERLRPHVKTHKLSEIVRMQMAHGITRFKCATIAEAETVASTGAVDVLLAYQPVGPNIDRLAELTRRFTATKFSAVADDPAIVQALSEAFTKAALRLDLYLDVDCGMHRTGVAPGEAAIELYTLIAKLPGLRPAGLHAYDGQIVETDPARRAEQCEQAFAPVQELRRSMVKADLPVPNIVAGGTPTFPTHARRESVECSPGTCLLWDAGYGERFPDLPFQPAGLVLTRVVSKPGRNRLCLDLGHKAIASENPHPRVRLLELPEARAVSHSEEHLVVETGRADGFAVGDALFGLPWHICPTVALYSDAVVVRNGHAEGRWKVVARQRRLTI